MKNNLLSFHDDKTDILIIILILFSLLLIFIFDAITPLSLTVWILYFFPLILTLFTRWKNGPYIVTGISTVLTYITHFISPVDIAISNDLINRVFFTFLLTTLAFLISSYKKNIDILYKSEESARIANKKLNLLSSITRHDIMNQLLTLNGFLSLFKENVKDPELVHFLDRSDKAIQIIERQILFTRDYQSMGIIAPSWQNVKESINKAKDALTVGSVTVDIDCADLEVVADPLFDKVFYNLIDNSLKHGGEKLTTIRIWTQETDSGLVLICEDNGVGIQVEDRPFLFTRGFGKNTGLGLFLIREILDITGMTIIENSITGKGARFEITVPKGVYSVKTTY